MLERSISPARGAGSHHPWRRLLCRASFTCFLGTVLVPAILAIIALISLPVWVAGTWVWLR